MWVVTFCSVGYRSSAFAQRLIAAGRRDVYNLEGSVFQWVNNGSPAEQNGKPVQTVHPYDAMWGHLLDRIHRADLTPVH
jgi:3-mercaptopyruvate sulfurtransferase SseA